MGWVKSSVFSSVKVFFEHNFAEMENPGLLRPGVSSKNTYLMFRNRHIRIPFQHIAQL